MWVTRWEFRMLVKFISDPRWAKPWGRMIYLQISFNITSASVAAGGVRMWGCKGGGAHSHASPLLCMRVSVLRPQRFIDVGRVTSRGPNAFNYNTLLPNKSNRPYPLGPLWRIAFNSRDPDIFYDRIMHYSPFRFFAFFIPPGFSRFGRTLRKIFTALSYFLLLLTCL